MIDIAFILDAITVDITVGEVAFSITVGVGSVVGRIVSTAGAVVTIIAIGIGTDKCVEVVRVIDV